MTGVFHSHLRLQIVSSRKIIRLTMVKKSSLSEWGLIELQLSDRSILLAADDEI